jgi:hypothetical protein
MRYIIWGWAAVFDADDRCVSDRTVLQELSTFIPDDDSYATDFLGGPGEESLAAAH